MKKLLLVAASLFISAVGAQSLEERLKTVEIKTHKVAGTVYKLEGFGGNIGVSAGKDGILMIDDQFAPLADKISAALKGIAETDLRYLINTHYHGDHTGGNEYFATHTHAAIMAHENVRKAMIIEKGKDHKSLPTVTYENGVKVFINDEVVHVRHLPSGHTSGDSYIYFEKANVLHTGDLFFESRFPYIDLKAGGNVDGYIKNVETIISEVPDDVVIIPGHGPITDKSGYQKFVNMIKETKAFVLQQKDAGKSVEEIIELGLPDIWESWSWQFINEERWIKTLY